MNPDDGTLPTLGTAPPTFASRATFPDSAVVQLLTGVGGGAEGRMIVELHPATVEVTPTEVLAVDGPIEWSWLLADLEEVIEGDDEPWTILVVPGVTEFGVRVPVDRIGEFRRLVGQPRVRPSAALPGSQQDVSGTAAGIELLTSAPIVLTPLPEIGDTSTTTPPPSPVFLQLEAPTWSQPQVEVEDSLSDGEHLNTTAELPIIGSASVEPMPTIPGPPRPAVSPPGPWRARHQRRMSAADLQSVGSGPSPLVARDISAWFGSHQVLDRVSLDMPAGRVTSLIGPSGCGKSTFLRILNRMHEMIPAASLAGEVLLDGQDLYDPESKLTDARKHVGMVFQKPNPFPAMSIYDNVLASLRLNGVKTTTEVKDEIVEACLQRAGLWKEVRDRLHQPGGGLSGGQQQRLCIARALAIRPKVLLMDEPCSALDPTSTRRIEETIQQLAADLTIVIVTHNMQQAVRVSDFCAFFLAEQGTPGVIVEHGPTQAVFESPQDQRTNDYVNGRFG